MKQLLFTLISSFTLFGQVPNLDWAGQFGGSSGVQGYSIDVDNNGNFVGLDDGLGGLEPRFSCNIMLDAGNNAFESVKEIASVFNGMAFWSNGTLDFFADQPKEVMMYFNNGNVFDGIFNYQTTSKSSLFN